MHSNITKDQNEGNNHSNRSGIIFVVGAGPGDVGELTYSAREAIRLSTIIIGYKRYVELLNPILKDKKSITSGMTEEVERCKNALELAEKGETVALVSSGDSGIYGMSGLIMELNTNKNIPIEIVPGVSSVNASAALLGAPLMHDFVVISLSDILTPWTIIEKRIRCAVQGDFVITLLNPKSKKRTKQVELARNIMKKEIQGKTPVGIVTNAFRKGQTIEITDLDNFTKKSIDMFSTVIIGNSQTYIKDNKLITPRGYNLKSL